MNEPFIFIRDNRKFKRIDLSELVYVESCRGYVKLVTTTGKNWLIQTTMLSLVEKLPADLFVRIHRSYIISIRRVLCFDSSQATIRDASGEQLSLPIGQNRYKDALMEKVVSIGDVAKGNIRLATVVE